MSVNLYDKAVLNKIKSWVRDPNMTITSPDENARLLSYVADVNDDKPIQLPLIALRREPDISLLNANKVPLTHDGAVYQADASFIGDEYVNKSIQINAIPIKINYQLDIYTRYMEECLEYVRNFVFNIVNYPNVEICIPYNDVNIQHDATMKIIGTVTDSSSIPERLAPGQFTRWTLKFFLDDAYLWNIPDKNNAYFAKDADVVVC